MSIDKVVRRCNPVCTDDPENITVLKEKYCIMLEDGMPYIEIKSALSLGGHYELAMIKALRQKRLLQSVFSYLRK